MDRRDGWGERMMRMPLPFRQGFVRGLAVLIPIAVTVGVLWILFDTIIGRFARVLDVMPLIRHLPYPLLLLLSLVLLVALTYATGVWATSYVGHRTLEWINRIFLKIPFARAIYRASQEAFAMLSHDTRQRFRPALVPFPREPLWAVGLVAQKEPVIFQGERYYYVYLPTTPSPATGWSFLVPAEKVRFLNVSVEEALRWVVSGGLLLTGAIPVDHEIRNTPMAAGPSSPEGSGDAG